MRYDKLFEPVSEDEPCGPDLDESEDDDYLNYTLTAEERIPGRFFDPDTGAPFDKSSIDLKSEVKQISKLLEGSRDIRLLCLEARFQCLAGQITGFCECIVTIAGLIERFWDHVHPIGTDDDFTMRQNTLEVLASRVTVLLPLQFAALIRDKRLGTISYRQHIVASGDVEAREGETSLDASTIVTALSDSANEPDVVALHALLLETLEALESIRGVFVEQSGFDYTPDFSDLVEALNDTRKLLERGQPSLAGDAPDQETGDIPEQGDGENQSTAAGENSSAPTSLSDGTDISISDQAKAIEALAAAESYFSANEPSSPALILVHQARQLVGKPLVDALQALLPDMAEKAVIKVNPATRFEIGIETMRTLSQSASSGISTSSGSDEFVGPQPANKNLTARTRHDATALIIAVEGYFKISEPSSPVPLLLSKARGYLSKDFNAIINDIIQIETTNQ